MLYVDLKNFLMTFARLFCSWFAKFGKPGFCVPSEKLNQRTAGYKSLGESSWMWYVNLRSDKWRRACWNQRLKLYLMNNAFLLLPICCFLVCTPLVQVHRCWQSVCSLSEKWLRIWGNLWSSSLIWNRIDLASCCLPRFFFLHFQWFWNMTEMLWMYLSWCTEM